MKKTLRWEVEQENDRDVQAVHYVFLLVQLCFFSPRGEGIYFFILID